MVLYEPGPQDTAAQPCSASHMDTNIGLAQQQTSKEYGIGNMEYGMHLGHCRSWRLLSTFKFWSLSHQRNCKSEGLQAQMKAMPVKGERRKGVKMRRVPCTQAQRSRKERESSPHLSLLR